MKRILIMALVALSLAACTTAAQRKYAAIEAGSLQAKQEAIACFADVYNKPDYASIVKHLPTPEHLRPTMAQLADDSFPTKEEGTRLIALHDEIIPCKEALLTKIEAYFPPLASIFADEMVVSDKLMLKLVKRKVSWGKYNQLRQELVTKSQQKARLSAQGMINELNAEHQNELAEREAAAKVVRIFAKALVNWSECHHKGGSLENCGSERGQQKHEGPSHK